MITMDKYNQGGQTLIETIVAIFLLATALSAAVGVSIYALTTSSNNFNQIVATNLAREGVEVVRMMRDSNWLALDASSNPNLQPGSCADIGGKFCYPDAFEQSPPASGQGVVSLAAGNYRIQYNSSTRQWSLQSNASYDLYQQADGSYSHTSNGASTYARMIKISKNTSLPYTNQNSNWELIVKSIVAWRGRNCPSFNSSQDLEALSGRCKVILEERLTNWKDYK